MVKSLRIYYFIRLNFHGNQINSQIMNYPGMHINRCCMCIKDVMPMNVSVQKVVTTSNQVENGSILVAIFAAALVHMRNAVVMMIIQVNRLAVGVVQKNISPNPIYQTTTSVVTQTTQIHANKNTSSTQKVKEKFGKWSARMIHSKVSRCT